MNKITAEDVKKVAHLARLDLPEDLICAYTKQLEKIIEYVAQLEQINTKDVPPTTRAVEVLNVTRGDKTSDSSIRDDLLSLGPDCEGYFYKVPKILDS